ncbi:MAG: DUF1254 domain-containing protein [Cytophagaceae bacterium]|nr:DUF1254 domain-containing protein [Cytophagaceae bacterium]MBL0325595.1 DUF1254 domain-containing protein [Cytophagaceae bacterium]
MKTLKKLLLLTLLFTSFTEGFSQITNKDELEAYKAAYNSFIWGYPVVSLGLESKRFSEEIAPKSAFNYLTIFTKETAETAEKRDVNEDIIYAKSYFDLKNTALIISLPALTVKSYYSISFNDAFSNNFDNFSSLKNLAKDTKILLVGPDYKGELPKNIKKVIKSPTNFGWIIARSSVVDKLELTEAKKTLETIKIETYPKAGQVSDYWDRNNIDFLLSKPETIATIASMDWRTYFKVLSQFLIENKIPESQAKYVADFAKIGLIPGEEYEKTKVKKSIERGIKQGFLDAVELLKNEAPKQIDYDKKGWFYNVGEGKWGNKYTKNAASAMNGFDQSAAEEFMKYQTLVDVANETLTGTGKGYKMTFKKLQLPATKAFWTINILDNNNLIYSNPKNKYGFNNKTKGIKLQKDGSLILFFQTTPPKNQEPNWIPIPEGEFKVVVKVYNPGEDVVSGEWIPQTLEKIK